MGHPSTANAIHGRSLHNTAKRHPWPFRVEPHISTDFGVGVPQRQEVEFRDGTRLWLHSVERGGSADLFLRALGAPLQAPLAGQVVDLRDLVPEVARDLPTAATRDAAGIVMYSLRGRFAGRDALVAAVQRRTGVAA